MSTKNENKLNIKPLGDRVIVIGISDINGNKTASGIIIPETVDKERPEKGKVVAVGDGRKNDDGNTIPLSVKVGDTILFSKYGPDEIKIDGVLYFIMREDAILAVIK